mmetsp:Transcript_37419/g.74560  ORF Transcript_37419/g.74560 Transcript_37419/m.74560 type:complete len:99 (-) Transcript_37419:1818-2114(-)
MRATTKYQDAALRLCGLLECRAVEDVEALLFLCADKALTPAVLSLNLSSYSLPATTVTATVVVVEAAGGVTFTAAAAAADDDDDDDVVVEGSTFTVSV